MRGHTNLHILNSIEWFRKIVCWNLKTPGHKSKQNCNTVNVGKMYLSLCFLKTSAISGSNYDKCLLVNVFYENSQSSSSEKPQTAQSQPDENITDHPHSTWKYKAKRKQIQHGMVSTRKSSWSAMTLTKGLLLESGLV